MLLRICFVFKYHPKIYFSRANESPVRRKIRLDQDRLDTAEARRNQSPTTSRDKRAAATTAMSKLREQSSPEESQEEKKKNTLSKALKRKTR